MPIKVNISLSAGGRLKPVASHTLHQSRITIGRDQDCTIALEDSQKHVSRVHAEFEADGDSYWVKVVSKVNPIMVNGQRFSHGDRVPVAKGDEVSVGQYRLEILEATAAAEATPVAPALASPAAASIASDPSADESTYVAPVDSVPAASQSAAGGMPALPDTAEDEVTYIPPIWARAATNRNMPGSQETSAEDMTYVRRPAAGAPPPARAKDEPAEAAQDRKPASSAALDFDLSEAFDAAPAPAAPPPAVTAAPLNPEVEEGFSDDRTYVRRQPQKPATPGAAGPPAGAKKPQSRNSLAEIEARIAAKAAEAASVTAPRASRGVSEPGSAVDPAVAAFLAGVGLPHLHIADAEKFMTESGRVVRAAVEGVMALLHERAEALGDLGAEPEPGAGDNPVTSTANSASVLEFLFDPKRPVVGDRDPARAFAAACNDLRAHQAALLEGMRAAVMSALVRIDPKKIEREHGSGLGVLNITRKSRMWDLLVAEHAKLTREMESDFAKVFGAEIHAAYAAQVRKMRGNR
ncbi:MAG: type VI secretion system-associated FHA domain protein TagH [Betaproteobacteria bacterium]